MQKSKAESHGGPNMTPMVDVVMCILIFFMLASAFLGPQIVLASQSPIEPGVGPIPFNAPVPAVRFTLTLERQGQATLLVASDGTRRTLGGTEADGGSMREEVAAYLAGKRHDLSENVRVIIAPAHDVSYQDVITLYDQCLHAGFSKVGFAPAR